MSERTIQVSVADRVAGVTLNRPEVHNAFDDHLIHELTHVLNGLGHDPGVRVVVLAGAGKNFSAGADLNWMKRMAGYSEAENLRDAVAMANLMRTLAGLPKPTIARVHGAAFGGGVGLVACCDIGVAGSDASFSLSEAHLGLIPAVISPYVIRAIGRRAAQRYFLSAEKFAAQEALRIGLVHEVAEPQRLDEAVARISGELLKSGPHAVSAAKRLIVDVADTRLDDAIVEETARRIANIRVSPEGHEGIAAFLEKRKPGWVSEDK
jgi:methylglutaconyl-CoA hydratase